MKKPTKKEWMEHHTEMHILAKQAARLNDYVFDPETKKEQMKYATKLITNTKLNDYVFDPKTSPQIQFENPKSLKKITMLDEIKPMKKIKIKPIVTIRVPMTKKELTAYAGKPCKDNEAGCPTCDAWKEWHSLRGYVSVLVNRKEIVSLMIRGEV